MTPETKGIVYLSGPISSNLDGYQKEFSLARVLVRKAGYTPVDCCLLPRGRQESANMRI